MSKVQRRWSREEDALLREETDLQLAGTFLKPGRNAMDHVLLTVFVIAQANDGDIKDWNKIAKKIPGRNNKDCRKRFMNEVQGGLKKVSLTNNPRFALSQHSLIGASCLRECGRKKKMLYSKNMWHVTGLRGPSYLRKWDIAARTVRLVRWRHVDFS